MWIFLEEINGTTDFWILQKKKKNKPWKKQ